MRAPLASVASSPPPGGYSAPSVAEIIPMRHCSSRASKGWGKKYTFPPVPEESVPVHRGHGETGGRPFTNMASQTESQELPSPPQTGLTDVLAAITNCHASVTSPTTKVDAVQLDVGLIRQDMDKMRSRITFAEQRISHMEDTVESHNTDLRMLHTKIRALEYKAEDAGNRNRRNNLRIVGMTEGVEGNHPTEFVEKFLRTLLPSAQFSPFYAVERAHHIPPKPGPQGSPPRMFILKFLHFRDRDEVLRAARVQGELAYQNSKILIFPDYSVETQKMRRSFDRCQSCYACKGH